MEYFAFLHGSVLLCSTHCSWLGVCAAPAGTHPLSSWERISLDSRIGEMLSHTEGLGGSGLVCAGTSPQTPSSSDTDCSEDQRGVSPIQAVCLTHIFLDMDQSFQNLPDTESQELWLGEAELSTSDWDWHLTKVSSSPTVCTWLEEREDTGLAEAILFSSCQWAWCVGAKRCQEEGTTRPINSYLKEVVTEVENFCYFQSTHFCSLN